MLKTKPTLISFIKDFSANTQKHSMNLLFVSILASFFVVIVLTVFFGLYYTLITRTDNSTILAVRFTFLMINYLLVLILASVVQIVTLKIFFDPQLKISSMITNVKSYFWRFLGLSIILNILFFLFSLPVYVAIFLFAIQNYILSMIAMLVGILLLLLFTSYIMFSPFVLIEKKSKIYHSIKESMDMASLNIWGIFVKLIILIALMVGLNYLASLFTTIPYVGQVIEIGAMFLFFILFIIYLFTIYQNLKIKAQS
jgi:hypothetical protein